MNGIWYQQNCLLVCCCSSNCGSSCTDTLPDCQRPTNIVQHVVVEHMCVFDTSTSTLNFKLDRLVDLAALGQVKLDCGSKPAELAAYCGSVVGYVADFGTESQFTEARVGMKLSFENHNDS